MVGLRSLNANAAWRRRHAPPGVPRTKTPKGRITPRLKRAGLGAKPCDGVGLIPRRFGRGRIRVATPHVTRL
jgi:hypothetical protein